MKKIKKNSIYLVLFLLGLFIGWLLFSKEESKEQEKNTQEKQVYTCPMHPQIRKLSPGKCPICGMELVLILDEKNKKNKKDFHSNAKEINSSDSKFDNLQSTKVKKAPFSFEVSISGKVGINKKNRSFISANFPGRIEKIFINSIGKEVKKGDLLAYIYSPELLVAQKELQEAFLLKDKPELYEAVKNKLRFWKLSENQIQKMLNSKETIFPIYTNQSGVITNLSVALGNYINTGSILAEIVDLSSVWILLDAYEKDLIYIKKGAQIEFSTQALPHKKFKAKLTYISPILDKDTQVVELRAELSNPDSILKPNMLVNASLKVDEKGTSSLIIPKSAVLWKGDQSVVYKKNSQKGGFEAKEITLGSSTKKNYFIKSGLMEGDEIALSGVFLLDSESSIKGHESMISISEAGNSKDQYQPELNKILATYFELKKALLKSDPILIKKSTNELKTNLEILNHINKENLHAGHFKQIYFKGQEALNVLLQAKTLEEIDLGFSKISSEILNFVEMIEIDRPLYKNYCPMALNNQGAYWLSETQQIENPFFGGKMLGCGSVEKIYEKKNTSSKTNKAQGHGHHH